MAFPGKGVSASCFTGEAYDLATESGCIQKCIEVNGATAEGISTWNIACRRLAVGNQDAHLGAGKLLPEYFYTDLRTQAHPGDQGGRKRTNRDQGNPGDHASNRAAWKREPLGCGCRV